MCGHNLDVSFRIALTFQKFSIAQNWKVIFNANKLVDEFFRLSLGTTLKDLCLCHMSTFKHFFSSAA